MELWTGTVGGQCKLEVEEGGWDEREVWCFVGWEVVRGVMRRFPRHTLESCLPNRLPQRPTNTAVLAYVLGTRTASCGGGEVLLARRDPPRVPFTTHTVLKRSFALPGDRSDVWRSHTLRVPRPDHRGLRRRETAR